MIPSDRIPDEVLLCVLAEYDWTLGRFPGNEHKYAALGEEVGELCEALPRLDILKATASEVFEEAVQTANVALMIAVQGCSDYPYAPDPGLPDRHLGLLWGDLKPEPPPVPTRLPSSTLAALRAEYALAVGGDDSRVHALGKIMSLVGSLHDLLLYAGDRGRLDPPMPAYAVLVEIAARALALAVRGTEEYLYAYDASLPPSFKRWPGATGGAA
jgi:hypothetical protein